jgi:hypothetical protein
MKFSPLVVGMVTSVDLQDYAPTIPSNSAPSWEIIFGVSLVVVDPLGPTAGGQRWAFVPDTHPSTFRVPYFASSQEVNDHIKRMCAAYLAVPQPTLTPVPYPGYSVDPEDIYFPMAE